ncbi:hypothetical protein HF1_13720 [Mycoplasma haemofelis str. Langford 1]|uniref:Uncharacterized protein n=1 Tax=Mycoplasma haemofelis (strain Langford 1) TaxID=941640 RepID=E8ZJQ9_MYCHL|nr:hypothetical protein [Mycoplasma haemofelis]CBY93380.1 hypothetical protein HF1_13720 [Mycoplasma haemofelis str. Langford 1]
MHSLFAKVLAVFVSATGTAGASVGAWKLTSKEKVMDIASSYVAAKYSDGYLGFWDKVNDSSLRHSRQQEMYLERSKDPSSLTFTDKASGLWEELVLFCRKMNKKVSKGHGLSRKEVRNIGWCNNSQDGYIPVNKKMSKRGYWADLLIRAKYKSSDFEFWGKLSEQRHEYTAKAHALLQAKGAVNGGTEALMKEAKVECDAFIKRFNDPKSKFSEKDIKTADMCRSSHK